MQKPLAVSSTSRRAADNENFQAQTDFRNAAQIEPAADPFSAYSLQRNAFTWDGTIRIGRIQMSLPHLNWYRVALEANGGEFPCCRLAASGGYNLLGVKEYGVIPPETYVLVFLHPSALYGYILGVIPPLTEDGNHTFPDWIQQGSDVGILRSRYYTEYLRLLSDEGGAMSFSAHRPLDSLLFDMGFIAETGVGIHVDPQMCFMRVDEECGITGFYLDRLLRIAGHNLDIWTAGRIEQDRNDEGELFYYRGESPYPWEMLGCYGFGTDISEEQEDTDVLHDKPVAKLEPVHDDLQPFVRYMEYGGYLGQGRLRTLLLPPNGKSESDFHRAEDTDAYLGVFREQIGLDGAYALESAKSVYIAKRSVIPVPKRIKESNDYADAECDSAANANYKFAGKYEGGGSREHKIGDLTTTETKTNLLSVAAILDAHAYTYNWKNLHPFYYHAKDYLLPEEDGLYVGSNQFIPDFSQITSKMWLPVPEDAVKEMKVDHRYGNVKYYELYQHLSFTDDGGVILQGGMGEELRMVGGNCQISCPGRVMIQSGNSTVIMSGDDTVIKSFNSVDITSTSKDVRIKAEGNGMFLAGNSGTGTLLLENRANDNKHTYPPEGGENIKGSGIILKSTNGEVATLAKDVYIRSGLPNGPSGQIVIDGNKGDGDVRIIGSSLYRFAKLEMRDGFGVPTVDSINLYTSSGTVMGGAVQINGSIAVNGSALIRSGLEIPDGSVSTVSGGEMGTVQNTGLLDSQLERIEQKVSEQTQAHEKDYESSIDTALYVTGAIGSDVTLPKISFSLRDIKQYGTGDFVLPQTHWQILNNVAQAGTVWAEKDVEYQVGTMQQPYPGKTQWEAETLLTLPAGEFKLYDLEKGVAKDRGTVYEDKKLGKFVKKAPNKEYRVLPSGNS